MPLDPLEMTALEHAIVRGWPARMSTGIDGWLARWSSGGSIRANSVAALTFTGADFDAALAEVVRFYRSRNAVPRFTITDIAAPAGLDRLLEQRGWQRTGQNVTYTKEVGSAAALPADPSPGGAGLQIEMAGQRNEAWSEIYLAGLSPDRRAIAFNWWTARPHRACFSRPYAAAR